MQCSSFWFHSSTIASARSVGRLEPARRCSVVVDLTGLVVGCIFIGWSAVRRSEKSAIAPIYSTAWEFHVVVTILADADDYSDAIPFLGCRVLHSHVRADV